MNYEEEIRRLQTLIIEMQAKIETYSARLSAAEATITALEKSSPAPTVAPHV